jgi:hypothetical protein
MNQIMNRQLLALFHDVTFNPKKMKKMKNDFDEHLQFVQYCITNKTPQEPIAAHWMFASSEMLACRAAREAASAAFMQAKKTHTEALDTHLEVGVEMCDARAEITNVTEQMHCAERDEAYALLLWTAARDEAAAIRHAVLQGMPIALDEVTAALRNEASTARVARHADAHRTRIFIRLSLALEKLSREELALYAANAAVDVTGVAVAVAKAQLDATVSAFAPWASALPRISSKDEMETPSDAE